MADTGRTVFADGLFADGFWATGFWAADEPVAVPDVDDPGTSQAAAVALIEGEGLVAAVVTAYSSTIPAGEVISQDPALGTLVAPGSTVTITVSLGEAPVADQTASGGWWPDYEHVQRERRKRRAEREAAEAEARADAQRIADETSREIFRLLREQEAREADRADLARLQALADKWAGKVSDLPKPVSVAVLNAQDARTVNALQQMERMVEQMLDEELLAVTQAVLLALD
jgi:hypothetical protein